MWSLRHLLLSLAYFEDAERAGAEIILLREAPWTDVKAFFTAGARELLARFREDPQFPAKAGTGPAP